MNARSWLAAKESPVRAAGVRLFIAFVALAFCLAAQPQFVVHEHATAPGEPPADMALLVHIVVEHGGQAPEGLHVHDSGITAVHALIDGRAEDLLGREARLVPPECDRPGWRDWLDWVRHRPPIA